MLWFSDVGHVNSFVLFRAYVRMAHARLSQSPSLLVSASGSRLHRSLCHRKYKKIRSPRFALEKNFELDLWASLGLRRQMGKFP